MNGEWIELEWSQFYASQTWPNGLFQTHAEFRIDLYEQMHALLIAAVLTEQAGPVAESKTVYDATNFPRWLPKWLQRRWTRSRAIKLTVTPRWSYPQASIKVPDLGRGVTFYLPPTIGYDDE